MISTTSIKCAVEVANCGSFRRASATLNLTQSAVSKQVALLERQLGVVLFIRSRSGVQLTTDGQLLLPRLVAATTALDSVVREAARVKVEQLRIASHRIGMVLTLPPVLRIVKAQFDGIEVALVHAAEDRSLEMLRTAEVDLALSFREIGGSSPSGIDEILLETTDAVLVVPSTHWLAARNSASQHDIQGETLILVKSPLVRGMTRDALDSPESIQWLTTTDTQAGLTMVREGVGIMITIRAALSLAPPDGLRVLSWEEDGGLDLTIQRRSGERLTGAPRFVWETLAGLASPSVAS